MTIAMSQKVENYFAKGPKKLLKIVPQSNYKLVLYYSDDSIRLYDLSDSLYGVFKVLEVPEIFEKVFIDDSGAIAWDKDPMVDSSVHWSNRIDICADAAYMDSIEFIENEKVVQK